MITSQITEFALVDSRYERKFHITDLSYYEVEALVVNHPAIFSEVFHSRAINNIYFDSCAKESYFEAVSGLTKREKVRIRWYGELTEEIKSPILEIKLKNEFCVCKFSFPLDSFKIDHNLTMGTINRVIEKSKMPDLLKEELKAAEFSLLNRYQRKYFLSADKKFRITLDKDLENFEIRPFGNSFTHSYLDDRSTILELKYDVSGELNADQITNYFPFRMTKSSKYTAGVDRVCVQF